MEKTRGKKEGLTNKEEVKERKDEEANERQQKKER